MILYNVRNGVISAQSVLKETKCGWRLHNNGFINRREMGGRFVHLDETFYTKDLDEARQWVKRTIEHIEHVKQVSQAAQSDIDFWIESGAHESDVPKSRFVEALK